MVHDKRFRPNYAPDLIKIGFVGAGVIGALVMANKFLQTDILEPTDKYNHLSYTQEEIDNCLDNFEVFGLNNYFLRNNFREWVDSGYTKQIDDSTYQEYIDCLEGRINLNGYEE